MKDIHKYSSSESARHIHRKASAKHQETYSTSRIAQQGAQLWVLLDINYNRNGTISHQQNIELARAWLSDLLLWSKQEYVQLQIVFPRRSWWKTRLETLTVKNTYQEALELVDRLPRLVPRLPGYKSWIAEFLSRVPQVHKVDGILLCSDFLGVDKKQADELAWLAKKTKLGLWQVPINQQEGQNYSGPIGSVADWHLGAKVEILA